MVRSGRTGWSPTTVRNLGSIVERHLKPGLGDLLVGDLTAALVDQFYERLRTEGRIDGSHWLSEPSVRPLDPPPRVAQAQRWSWVFDNVADHASPPKGEPVEMRPPTPAEVARLLESVADELATPALPHAGRNHRRRRGQLLAVRWTDVDLTAGSLSMQRSVVEGPRAVSFPPRPVVRTGSRSIPAAWTLRSHRERVTEENGAGAIEQLFVFCADL